MTITYKNRNVVAFCLFIHKIEMCAVWERLSYIIMKMLIEFSTIVALRRYRILIRRTVHVMVCDACDGV